MLQKEMALFSFYQSYKYNKIRILIKLYYICKYSLSISPQNFFPQVYVNSSIIQILQKHKYMRKAPVEKIAKICRFLFISKKYINSLLNKLDITKIDCQTNIKQSSIFDILIIAGRISAF